MKNSKIPIILLSIQYTLIWGGIHLVWLDSRFFTYAMTVALGYGIGTCWSGIYRGRLALSADPYALISAFGAAVLWFALIWNSPFTYTLLFQCIVAFFLSLIIAHAGAFLSIFLASYLQSNE